eukprot:TRINITY_DN90946_c0_g1_i1.p1 TRINITY_DN90946_c0_g1~~TRINITY_DN90946_c0_g1_i1.p1  ORF type:complete len:1344 (-),score=295.17 TRINITY_DN90946_c0_g1_i1:197-4228(-)
MPSGSNGASLPTTQGGKSSKPPLPSKRESAAASPEESQLPLAARTRRRAATTGSSREAQDDKISQPMSPAVSARRVRYSSEEADVGARQEGRRMAVFFLDPAQLLKEMKTNLPSKEADDDDSSTETDSKDASIDEKEEKDPKLLGSKTTGDLYKQIRPSAKKHFTHRQSRKGDNEYIQVAIRVRPFLERNKGDRSILQVQQDENQISIETGTSKSKPGGVQDSPIPSHREGSKTYKFDFVLDSRTDSVNCASQEDVYENVGTRIVRCALDGYNACLFAYGQTGTGKTHTVMGDIHQPEKRGLLPRILEGLFEELDEAKKASGDPDKKSSLQISYLEIFNEQIHDLLVPPKADKPREALQVRYHPTYGVMINDLTQSSASTIGEAMELVDFGTRMRSIASTSMNSRSSRAHTVFTFRFEQTSKDGETQMAQVQLVDLAGREQERSSSDNKDRLRERQFINTSLFHLSTCITNLSRYSKGNKVNPADFAFRNSRLTLLLANSLTGNSRTGMIGAVSPASSDLDETLSTLRFADQVKKIRTTVTSNRVNKANVVKQLQEEISRLKQHISQGFRANSDEQISQLEAVCAHFKDALEQEKTRSQALAAERAQCLKEMGLSVTTDRVSIVVGGDKDMPYLVNLSEDPYLQGCLMYFLPGPEEVTIGSADGNTVRLSGLGIKPRHCVIRNEGNRRLTMHPIGVQDIASERDKPRVFLNGRRVTEPVNMCHQDRLVLGHACAFRVVLPLTASELRAAVPSAPDGGEKPDLPDYAADLEEALAEIEDSSSQSLQHLRKYVEDLEHGAGLDAARVFVRELHRAVPLVREANQITSEVDIDTNFQLQVLNDLCSSQSTAPEMVVAAVCSGRRSSSPAFTEARVGWRLPTSSRGELKFVWTFEKFCDRLQAMRDIYEEMGGSSNRLVQTLQGHPFNPWKELSDSELRMMVESNVKLYPLMPPMSPISSAAPSCFPSRQSSKQPSKSLNRVESLDAKSDELLARSQFLMKYATEALDKDANALDKEASPRLKFSVRPRHDTVDSLSLFNYDKDEDSLEQLEMQVQADIMQKLMAMGHDGYHRDSRRHTSLPCPPGSSARSSPNLGLRPRPVVSFSQASGSGSVGGSSSCLGGNWYGEDEDEDVSEDADNGEVEIEEGVEGAHAKKQRQTALSSLSTGSSLPSKWKTLSDSLPEDVASLLELTAELRKDNVRLQRRFEELWWKDRPESKVAFGGSSGSREKSPRAGAADLQAPVSLQPQRLQARPTQQLRFLQSPQQPPVQEPQQLQHPQLAREQQRLQQQQEELREREQQLQMWSDQLGRKEEMLQEMHEVLVELQAKATSSTPCSPTASRQGSAT